MAAKVSTHALPPHNLEVSYSRFQFISNKLDSAQEKSKLKTFEVIKDLYTAQQNSKLKPPKLSRNQTLSDDSKEAIMTIVCLISVTILTLTGIAIFTVYNQHYKKSTPILESEMQPMFNIS